jgi:hypothetical protein
VSAVSKRLPPPDAEGHDLRPDPLQASTPAEFVRALRHYRVWAGDPPLRVIARRSGVGASTICTALSVEAMPPLNLVLAIVEGCGAGEHDQRRFATAWRAIRLAAQDDSPAGAGHRSP